MTTSTRAVVEAVLKGIGGVAELEHRERAAKALIRVPRPNRHKVAKAKGPRQPRMSRHSSGQARVRLSGKVHYLGAYDSPEAHERYGALLREWRDGGKQPLGERLPHAGEVSYTAAELARDFLGWLDSTGRYQKRGEPTSYRHTVEDTLRSFIAFAGAVPVRKLTEGLLVQWRDRIEAEYPHMVRGNVNRRLGLVLATLRWGRARGAVPTATWASCSAVQPLKRGECGQRPERLRERRAVSREDVEKVAARCPARVAAMMALQLATGMRPGEARCLRWCDVDKAGPSGTWLYAVPGGGKTEHHGRTVKYFLGAAAQAVLQQLPPCLPSAPVFGCISGEAYAQAVRRACRLTGVPHFCPHELRHSALTRIAEQAGIAAASAAAGHASIATTARYYHRNDSQALLAVAVLDRASTG